jgi:phospholipid transport system substrate-binding protein
MTLRLQEARQTIRRRTVLPFVAALALAAGETCAATARADTTDAVDRPLVELHRALEATMRAGRSISFSRRFDALAPVVDHVFDLETVLKVSVGARWDSMDDDVRNRLLRAYRRFTVATYVANFDKYDGETFRIIPGLRNAGADRIVGTEIINDGGEHFRMDYVMRDVRGSWRAVDVLLEGSISRVAVQRSDFRKILANGDPDALIASLKRKIADLSDGALSS